ncbi:CRM-domain containing factor CFM9, mitochondrial [Lycium ferocissimum]|uniref:CRM-domain containing factor CFM9, mitochondrial n=1 Tax=Lycium ferocissimum TaxID=112874 RepID=UPI002815D414|nr:CRM-domain containing factor CFM9, mitochondrial [Lycium ferocissimum]
MLVSRYIQRRSLTTLASLLSYTPLQNVILRRYDSVNMISSGGNMISSPVKYVKVPIFTSTNVWNCNVGVRWMSGKSMRSRVAMRMQNESSKTLREIRRSKKLKLKLMTDEERLIYNLRRAKKKVALLLQKLKKYELPDLPFPRHDPELLTPEQLQAYKKIGFRNKNYVPVGVRGVFGGVVQNMHLHWKFHETVQVCCDNFPKEKIKEMASMLARLSGGIVVNIHNVKTIIMFRGRNYRQPKNLIPMNTLTKRKALFKARFEQALESQKLNIKKIEQELRRKGINPDDPTARASIQRVASTFFNAIDKKEGSPYVFQDDNGTHSGSVDEKHSVAEDSDQEELDNFIAQIEKAADDEWAAEEEAEKEEAGKLRYWNKEDIGSRFRSSGMIGSDESDNETGGRTSGGSKTYGRNIADDDDEHDDVSEDDGELDDDDDRRCGRRDTDTYKAPVRHPKYKTEKWQKGKSNRPKNEGGPSRNFDPYLKGTMATDGSAPDMLSDLEEAMWTSDDEGGQNSTQPSEYRSSSDEGEDYDKIAKWESDAEDAPGSRASSGVGNSFRTRGQGQMKKNEDTRESRRKVKSSKDFDETWDSD